MLVRAAKISNKKGEGFFVWLSKLLGDEKRQAKGEGKMLFHMKRLLETNPPLEEFGIFGYLCYLIFKQNPSLEPPDIDNCVLEWERYPGLRANSHFIKELLLDLQDKGLLKLDKKSKRITLVPINEKNFSNELKEGDGKAKNKPIKKWKSPDLLTYFARKYEETFGVRCLVSYARDCSILKRIAKDYQLSPQELYGIIRVLFEIRRGKFPNGNQIGGVSALSVPWFLNSLLTEAIKRDFVSFEFAEDVSAREIQESSWESPSVRRKRMEKNAV